MRDTKETHGKLVTHPWTLQVGVDIFPLTPLAVVSLLTAEYNHSYSQTGGRKGGILLARLFSDDAVVLAPAPVHTVVRYRALAAVQGASITLSHG